MKTLKIIIIVFAFVFLPLSAFCADVYFVSQEDVDADEKWAALNMNNIGFFYGANDKNSFKFQKERTLGSGIKLRSYNDKYIDLEALNSSNRFFTFNAGNAILNLNKINLAYGQYSGDNTAGGGAIYISGTNFTLNADMSFSNNNSSVSGGAIYLNLGTATFTANLNEKIIFRNNAAKLGYGGAIYSGGGVRFTNNTYVEISSNTASISGGGVYANNGDAIFGGNAYIKGNTVSAGSGGGVYSSGNIEFSLEGGNIIISSNTSQQSGGALCAHGGYITFKGNASITGNRTSSDTDATFKYGGALYAGKDISFTFKDGNINLEYNKAVGKGGALYSNGKISFQGSANIVGNSITQGAGESVVEGGALWANGDISFNNKNVKVHIFSNVANYGNGAALFSENGKIIMRSYIEAKENRAQQGYGGFLVSKGVILEDGGIFTDNVALSSGAVMYINGNGNDYSIIRANHNDVLFENNMANNRRNDIHLDATSANANLSFDATEFESKITLSGGITHDKKHTTFSTVEKIGKGNLILNGDNYLDSFNLNAGRVTFGDTAIFEANNTVMLNKTLFNMRNFSSSDKYTINTNLQVNSGATLYYDINSDNNKSDKISVKGNASALDGSNIRIGVSGLSAYTKTYRIMELTSKKGSGTFNIDLRNSDLSEDVDISKNTMSRVKAYLLYDGKEKENLGVGEKWQNVDLVVKIDQLNVIKGLTANQRQIALSLDRDYGRATGDLFYMIDELDKLKTVNEKKEALKDLSGHVYANAITMPAFNTSKNNVLSRLKKSYFIADDSPLKRNVWAQGYGSNNKYSGNKNSPGDFEAFNSGVQAGFDTMIDESQIFGITLGYLDTHAQQKNDTVDIKGYSVGGYGAYFFENNIEAKCMFIGSRQNYDSLREIKYLDRKTRSDFSGYSLNLSGEAAYKYYYKNDIYFEPFIGLDIAYVETNKFSEEWGNNADLIIYPNNYTKFNTLLGLQVNNGTDMRFKWYGELKLDLLLVGRTGKFKGEYKNTSHKVTIEGIQNDTFNVALGGGILYDISSSFSTYANINGLLSGTQMGLYGNIGINYKFATKVQGFFDR